MVVIYLIACLFPSAGEAKQTAPHARRGVLDLSERECFHHRSYDCAVLLCVDCAKGRMLALDAVLGRCICFGSASNGEMRR